MVGIDQIIPSVVAPFVGFDRRLKAPTAFLVQRHLEAVANLHFSDAVVTAPSDGSIARNFYAFFNFDHFKSPCKSRCDCNMFTTSSQCVTFRYLVTPRDHAKGAEIRLYICKLSERDLCDLKSPKNT